MPLFLALKVSLKTKMLKLIPVFKFNFCQSLQFGLLVRAPALDINL